MTPKSALLIFIAAVLTILLFGFCPAIIRSLRSRAWPHAIGHITEISIYHDPPVRRVYIWRVRMRYIFNINGKKFYGTRYTSTGEFYSGRKDYCCTFLNNHPVGSVVTVYYNPQNPYDCLIKPSIDYRHIFIMAFILLLLLLELGILVGWIRVVKQ